MALALRLARCPSRRMQYASRMFPYEMSECLPDDGLDTSPGKITVWYNATILLCFFSVAFLMALALRLARCPSRRMQLLPPLHYVTSACPVVTTCFISGWTFSGKVK
ncbi:hypothetical protein BJV82DRAFT_605782 [Fennellomyces sp. T-0311]|nr:hypothetical protein BJV82DRAFT_605782 [Fennellomyces sp. T-0311]